MNSSAHKNLLHQAIYDSIRNIAIFSDLGASDLELITRVMHVSRVDKGGVVFKEGDPGDYVCFVVEGTVEVLKATDKGIDRPIAELGAGSSIGEMAVIGKFLRSATVKSKNDATLLTLTRDRFNQICTDYPWIGVKMLRAIAQLLSEHLKKTSKNLSELMPPT
jgi:CRP/FNR family transcriptional regulator, cyclic AMP receptor protein